jgi:hypothetical protein
MARERSQITFVHCRNSNPKGQVYTSRNGARSMTKANTAILIIGYLMLCSSVSAQQQAREVKGGGHLLGETADQFFSEGTVADLARACQDKDWKTVKQLFKNPDYASKANAKDICAKEKLLKQQATSGERLEYNGRGDDETMRADTFTFDGGHLVKIDMVYTAPVANVVGFHPKSYDELYAGLEEAYGPPSKSYSEPRLDAIGVKYDAHHAVWMGPQDVISIHEQPGTDGWSEIVAETLAEHDRAVHAPKSRNPLQ